MAILSDPDSLRQDFAECDDCGVATPLLLLDSKPSTGSNVTLLCKGCYGPGWMPMGEEFSF